MGNLSFRTQVEKVVLDKIGQKEPDKGDVQGGWMGRALCVSLRDAYAERTTPLLSTLVARI